MTSVTITGIGDDEKEAIEQAADEAEMTTAEFCRTRFRAGWRLWDAGGDFDVLEMQERLNEDQPTGSSQSTPTKPKSAAKADRFETEIKRNLPTSEDDAISKEELIEIVGEKVVLNVLKDLRKKGEAEYVIEQEGFVRQ